MVAGDDQAGDMRELVEEGAGGAELFLFRTLGEVAGDDKDVGRGLPQRSEQSRDKLRVFAAEVQVGEVGESLQAGSFRGMRTLSEAGRVA